MVLVLGDLVFIQWVRNYYLCFCLLEEIVENWHNFFPKCLMQFTSELIGAWWLLFEKWSFLDWIISYVQAYWYYFLLVWDLADCVFQGICPFLLGYRICGHRIMDSILYFNIHKICCDVTSFIFYETQGRLLSSFHLAWLEVCWFYRSFQRFNF